MSDERQSPERTAVSFMGRHFVALSCMYESLNTDGSVFHSGTMIFSGFIIEFVSKWYWVTAGHCLQEELDEYIKRKEIRMLGGSFIDYLGHEAQHFHTYPYTYEPGDGQYIYRPEVGLDFAIVPLDDLMKAAFSKNGIVPIDRENWIHQPNLSFDFYRMLGIPRGRVVTSQAPDGTESVSVGLALLAIDAASQGEIESIPDQRPNMFIGKIATEARIDTIKGMSGGPIYGFRRDSQGRLFYHAVAVQSSWYPDSRIICGCPLTVFAETVYHILSGNVWKSEEPDDVKSTPRQDETP